jgi:hypothetical protein
LRGWGVGLQLNLQAGLVLDGLDAHVVVMHWPVWCCEWREW